MLNMFSKPATQEDVDAGRAIFCVPDERSKIYDLGVSLPVRAKTRKDIGNEEENPIPAGSVVEVVQCEIVDGTDVLVGFRQDSEEGVCSLEEIEILPAQP